MTDAFPTYYHEKGNTEPNEYELYRAKWQLFPKYHIVDRMPLNVDMELNTTCNLKCTMCWHSFDPPEPKLMSITLIKKIIDEAAYKGVAAIKFNWRGEPLLFIGLSGIIKAAKDKGIMDTLINTNATKLNAKMAEELIDAGLDKITFSVDGCTMDMYEKIRVGANYENVVSNIKFFFRLRRSKGVENPIIAIEMVKQDGNEGQLESFLKYWDGFSDKIVSSDVVEYKEVKEDGTPLPDFSCPFLWQRLFITADGWAVPCCRAIQGGNQLLEVLGNVEVQSIEELWNSQRLNEIRFLHEKGRSHEIKMCKLCGMRHVLIAKADT